MASSDQIEKMLVGGGLCKESLKQMANILADVESDMAKVEDVLVDGITAPDLAEVRVRVEPSAVGLVIEQLSRSGLRPEFRVFPRGIINPDRLEVVARFGNRSR